MDIKSALDKLFSLHQFGIKLGLENTLNLLDKIGNPHRKLRAFHIAGSNGKGSTASFIASILMEAGYKVGLYTSPHFRIYNERIRINGEMIGDEYVADFVTKLEEYIEANSTTFFEITTALAFKYFEENNVDYAVIETGLGGRLDATNVIDPIVSVITSISLEHTQHLGGTIELIAAEKAGIIKSNSIVLTGKVPFEAENVFREKSEKNSSLYIPFNHHTIIENDRVKVILNDKNFTLYSTPLKGDHQFFNAALAVKAVSQSIKMKNGIFFSMGIRNVIKNSGIEGRYEVVSSEPRIIMDSAHNPEGVSAFINEFSKEYERYRERVLIFGAMRDKSIELMLSALYPYFTEILVTKIEIERSASIEELISMASSQGVEVKPLLDPSGFTAGYSGRSGNCCLVVLGSMYLLGEIKSKMFNKKA